MTEWWVEKRNISIYSVLSRSRLSFWLLSYFHVRYFMHWQAIVSDINTMFIENVIFIMKNILENKVEQPNDHLGITSIEGLMLAVVRWVGSRICRLVVAFVLPSPLWHCWLGIWDCTRANPVWVAGIDECAQFVFWPDRHPVRAPGL